MLNLKRVMTERAVHRLVHVEFALVDVYRVTYPNQMLRQE
jgi:hypothetical protein